MEDVRTVIETIYESALCVADQDSPVRVQRYAQANVLTRDLEEFAETCSDRFPVEQIKSVTAEIRANFRQVIGLEGPGPNGGEFDYPELLGSIRKLCDESCFNCA